jgi:hypothetical protein
MKQLIEDYDAMKYLVGQNVKQHELFNKSIVTLNSNLDTIYQRQAPTNQQQNEQLAYFLSSSINTKLDALVTTQSQTKSDSEYKLANMGDKILSKLNDIEDKILFRLDSPLQQPQQNQIQSSIMRPPLTDEFAVKFSDSFLSHWEMPLSVQFPKNLPGVHMSCSSFFPIALHRLFFGRVLVHLPHYFTPELVETNVQQWNLKPFKLHCID